MNSAWCLKKRTRRRWWSIKFLEEWESYSNPFECHLSLINQSRSTVQEFSIPGIITKELGSSVRLHWRLSGVLWTSASTSVASFIHRIRMAIIQWFCGIVFKRSSKKHYINDDENNSGLIDSGAMDGQYFRPRSASFLHYIQHSRTGPRSVSSISQMYPILPRVASPAKPALQFTKWGDGGVLSLLFSSCHTQ